MKQSLIDEFVSNVQQGNIDTPVQMYGTGKIVDGKTYILLDGAENMTPCETSMRFLDGDRLLCTLQGHEITVQGNVSVPVDARSAIEAIFVETKNNVIHLSLQTIGGDRITRELIPVDNENSPCAISGNAWKVLKTAVTPVKYTNANAFTLDLSATLSRATLTKCGRVVNLSVLISNATVSGTVVIGGIPVVELRPTVTVDFPVTVGNGNVVRAYAGSAGSITLAIPSGVTVNKQPIAFNVTYII